MDIKSRTRNRKNSIDRWTPSFEYAEIEEDKLNDKAVEGFKNKIDFGLPCIASKPMMAKSKSDGRNFVKEKLWNTKSKDKFAFPVIKPSRIVYKAKSPTVKMLKKPLLNLVSLSPFVNDAKLSNSPRYHYGQEYIKSIFVKK